MCVLSNNEHQQELHRQAYQEFHTHKQASDLKIVEALLAIEVYFIMKKLQLKEEGAHRWLLNILNNSNSKFSALKPRRRVSELYTGTSRTQSGPLRAASKPETRI